MNLLPSELMDEVVGHMRLERYRAGDAIVRQGEVGDRMYIVKSGHVSVVLEQDGGEVVLTRLARADYFGEIALLEEVPRTATCRCLDAVEVYMLERVNFQRLLARSRDFGVAMRAEGSARALASRSLLLLRG
jgi:ATP-binding cassette subfamily B protein